jgi:predicted O-methyltransferase YrrM
MNTELRSYLERLHADGLVFDAAQPDRLNRRRNLDPETAQFISMQIRLMRARSVVEIGTSNGYGTIWLADAVRGSGGSVTTLDINAQTEAIANATEAGVGGVIEFVMRDAGDFLGDLPDGTVDVLFLDAERTEYEGWWTHPYRVLRPGGLMLIDNAYRPAPEELDGFVALLEGQDDLDRIALKIGSGLILVYKASTPTP